MSSSTNIPRHRARRRAPRFSVATHYGVFFIGIGHILSVPGVTYYATAPIVGLGIGLLLGVIAEGGSKRRPHPPTEFRSSHGY